MVSWGAVMVEKLTRGVFVLGVAALFGWLGYLAFLGVIHQTAGGTIWECRQCRDRNWSNTKSRLTWKDERGIFCGECGRWLRFDNPASARGE